MANATYLIEVDWDLDGDFTDTYDDISADVKSIHFSRGKTSELDNAEVGQLSITVNNATAKYTPNGGGVISALLLPKRPIRVRATYGINTYSLFYGFIEEIIPHPHLSEQDCIITATDGLDYLSRHDLGTILVKDQLTGYLHKEILADAGWPNSGIVTSGLLLNTPLWQYDLNGSTFYSKDDYQRLCTVTGATWGNTGRTFDGNDKISLDSRPFTGASAATVEAWIYPTDTTSWRCAVGEAVGGGVNESASLVLYNNLVYFDTRTTSGRVNVTASFSINAWSHWVGVYDGAFIYLYKDGVLIAGPTAQTGTLVGAIDYFLGSSGSADFFIGIEGEVILYNRALTSAEIQHNHMATVWRYNAFIDAGQDSVPYWYGSDIEARLAQDDIDESEQGFSFVDGAGNFRFEDRHHRSTAQHQTSQATFNNTMNNITYSLNPRHIYNIIKATVTPWTIQAEAELWRLKETQTIPIGETYTYWGDASVSGTSVFVDAWTALNSGATDYTISGTFTIAQTNFAKSIKIVITNIGTTPNTITLLKARGTWYNEQTKVTIKAEDTTSQSAYQKRTFVLDGKYMTDIEKAQGFVDYAIGKYKDPRAELSMTIINQDAATLTQILSREISDRITIVNDKLGINPTSTGPFYFIDHMEHDISISGLSHTVTYRLSDSINEDFWCLDYSRLNTNTKVGY